MTYPRKTTYQFIEEENRKLKGTNLTLESSITKLTANQIRTDQDLKEKENSVKKLIIKNEELTVSVKRFNDEINFLKSELRDRETQMNELKVPPKNILLYFFIKI